MGRVTEANYKSVATSVRESIKAVLNRHVDESGMPTYEVTEGVREYNHRVELLVFSPEKHILTSTAVKEIFGVVDEFEDEYNGAVWCTMGVAMVYANLVDEKKYELWTPAVKVYIGTEY